MDECCLCDCWSMLIIHCNVARFGALAWRSQSHTTLTFAFSCNCCNESAIAAVQIWVIVSLGYLTARLLIVPLFFGKCLFSRLVVDLLLLLFFRCQSHCCWSAWYTPAKAGYNVFLRRRTTRLLVSHILRFFTALEEWTVTLTVLGWRKSILIIYSFIVRRWRLADHLSVTQWILLGAHIVLLIVELVGIIDFRSRCATMHGDWVAATMRDICDKVLPFRSCGSVGQLSH